VNKRTLIIAEKPSVARDIAKFLGIRGNGRGGRIDGPDHVLTWAVGHLVNIAEPEVQNPRWKGRWSLGQLPMIPGRFTLSVLEKTQDQFEVVKALLNDGGVGEVINATDAGREGELIFRRIYVMAGCTKPIRRLWASDMTEEGLKKAFAALMDGEDKRNLGLASFARAEADWLVGMNFSRLFTVRDGGLVSVGRVQTPVLKLLVDRRREIEHFTPKDFWTVEGMFARPVRQEDEEAEPFKTEYHLPPEHKETRLDSEADALAVLARCRGAQGQVLGVTSRRGNQKPPLPFDLTTLQREANSRHGLSAKETLAVAQSLYEKRKLLTYPRTDSRHLTRDLFKGIVNHLRSVYPHFPDIASVAGNAVKDPKAKFACVNDKKVSDHHAIIPTTRKADPKILSPNEWAVYEMVCRRLCAALMPKAQYASSTVWIEVPPLPEYPEPPEHPDRFKATGKIFKDKGWLVAEPWRAAKDNPLPALKKGQKVDVHSVEHLKRQTKAPAHFTDASLLGAMETAGKLVEDDALREAMKERGLGTPATRAQTIETLISRGFVDKDKKKLIASDRGCAVIDAVTWQLPEVASPELTGEWESKLKSIEGGKLSYPEFMQEIRTFVHSGVMAAKSGRRPRPAPPQSSGHVADHALVQPGQSDPSGRSGNATQFQESAGAAPTREPLGDCPLCNGRIIEGERGYGCSNWRPEAGACPFVVWKEFSGGRIPRRAMRDLLAKGRTYSRIRFVSKAGKRFNAFLKLNGQKLEIFFE
jgi:DNA topoisomerase-3